MDAGSEENSPSTCGDTSSQTSRSKPIRRRRLAHRRQYNKSRRLASSYLRTQFVRYDTFSDDLIAEPSSAPPTSTALPTLSADERQHQLMFTSSSNVAINRCSNEKDSNGSNLWCRMATIDSATPSTSMLAYGGQRGSPANSLPLAKAHGSSHSMSKKAHSESRNRRHLQQSFADWIQFESNESDSSSYVGGSEDCVDYDSKFAGNICAFPQSRERGRSANTSSTIKVVRDDRSISSSATDLQHNGDMIRSVDESGAPQGRIATCGSEKVVRSETIDLNRVQTDWGYTSTSIAGLKTTASAMSNTKSASTRLAWISSASQSSAHLSSPRSTEDGKDHFGSARRHPCGGPERHVSLYSLVDHSPRKENISSECIDNVHFNDLFHGSVNDSSTVTMNQSVRTDPRLYKDDVDIKFSRALNSCKLPQIRYASKERLFERLTDLRFLSIDFLNTFLLTYRVFTTAEDILEALKGVHYNSERYTQQSQNQQQHHLSSLHISSSSVCAFANTSLQNLIENSRGLSRSEQSTGQVSDFSLAESRSPIAAPSSRSPHHRSSVSVTSSSKQQTVSSVNGIAEETPQHRQLSSKEQSLINAPTTSATTGAQQTPTKQRPVVPPRSPSVVSSSSSASTATVAAAAAAALLTARHSQKEDPDYLGSGSSNFLVAPSPHHQKRRSTISALSPITGSTSSSLVNLNVTGASSNDGLVGSGQLLKLVTKQQAHASHRPHISSSTGSPEEVLENRSANEDRRFFGGSDSGERVCLNTDRVRSASMSSSERPQIPGAICLESNMLSSAPGSGLKLNVPMGRHTVRSQHQPQVNRHNLIADQASSEQHWRLSYKKNLESSPANLNKYNDEIDAHLQGLDSEKNLTLRVPLDLLPTSEPSSQCPTVPPPTPVEPIDSGQTSSPSHRNHNSIYKQLNDEVNCDSTSNFGTEKTNDNTSHTDRKHISEQSRRQNKRKPSTMVSSGASRRRDVSAESSTNSLRNAISSLSTTSLLTSADEDEGRTKSNENLLGVSRKLWSNYIGDDQDLILQANSATSLCSESGADSNQSDKLHRDGENSRKASGTLSRRRRHLSESHQNHCSFHMKEIEFTESGPIDCDTSGDEDKAITSSDEEEEHEDDDDDSDSKPKARGSMPSDDSQVDELDDKHRLKIITKLNSVRLEQDETSCGETDTDIDHSGRTDQTFQNSSTKLHKPSSQTEGLQHNDLNGSKKEAQILPAAAASKVVVANRQLRESSQSTPQQQQPNRPARQQQQPLPQHPLPPYRPQRKSCISLMASTTLTTSVSNACTTSLQSATASRATTPRSSFQHYTSDTVGGISKAGVIISSSSPRVSSRRSSTASAASAFAAATAASNNPILTQPPASLKGATTVGGSSGISSHAPSVYEFTPTRLNPTEGLAPECTCSAGQQLKMQFEPPGQRHSPIPPHHPQCSYLIHCQQRQLQQQQQSVLQSPLNHQHHQQQQHPVAGFYIPPTHSDASSLCNSRASSRLSSCAGLDCGNNVSSSYVSFASSNTGQPSAWAGGSGGAKSVANSSKLGNQRLIASMAGGSMGSVAVNVHRGSASKRNSTQINIRSVATIRVLSVLRHWVSKHSQDFVNDSKLSYLVQEFLQDLIMDSSLLPAEHKAALQLQQMIQKAVHFRGNMVDLDALLAPPERPSPDSIETLSALEIAEGMTYLDHKIFLAIRSEEFLGQAWMKVDKAIKAPHILLITKRFNDVSRLVSSEITRVPELHRRVAIIEKWTNVAHICRVVHNFNGVLQICAAFTNSAVFRLKKTWDKIPKTTRTTIDQLQNLVSTDSRFRNMRDAINRCDPPSIPYVGMYLTDLSFIEEGTPNCSPDGLLNFSKMRMIAHVIREIQHLQNGVYKIEYRKRVANYLLDSSRHLQDDEMYRCSLAIEPKSTGGKNGIQSIGNASQQGTGSGLGGNTGQPASFSANTSPSNN